MILFTHLVVPHVSSHMYPVDVNHLLKIYVIASSFSLLYVSALIGEYNTGYLFQCQIASE